MSIIIVLVAAGVCQLILGYLGFHVTVTRPTERSLIWFRIAFLAVGALGTGLLVASGVMNQQSLNSNFGVLGTKIDAIGHILDERVSPFQLAPPPRDAYCAVPDNIRSGIVDALKSVGQQKVALMALASNSPAQKCAAQWAQIFRDSGWDVEGPNCVLTSGALEGIIIKVGPGPRREEGKQVSLNDLPIGAAALIKILQGSHPLALNLDPSIKDQNAFMFEIGDAP